MLWAGIYHLRGICGHWTLKPQHHDSCLLEKYPLHWLISVDVILTVQLIYFNLKTCRPVHWQAPSRFAYAFVFLVSVSSMKLSNLK